MTLILINVILFLFALITDFSWYKLLLGFAIAKVFSIFGHQCGLHRLWAHRSYKIAEWKEYILLALSIPVLHGSTITYSGIHRQHHAYSDTPKDPHLGSSPWWKVVLLKMPDNFQVEKKFVVDLLKDPVHRWVHRHYFKINLSLLILLILTIGPILTGWTLGCVVTYSMISGGITNTLAHIPKFGTRTFNTNDRSTNNLLVQLITWNEGLHNHHHKKPNSWDYRINPGDVDVPALAIKYFLIK